MAVAAIVGMASTASLIVAADQLAALYRGIHSGTYRVWRGVELVASVGALVCLAAVWGWL